MIIMFGFELKKLLRNKAVIASIIIYILISIFWFRAFIEKVDGLKIDVIYGSFFDLEMYYVEAMIVIVCILVTQLIPLEYSTNMMPVLSLTKNGKKKFWNIKIKMAFLLSNGCYFIYLFVLLVSWFIKFGFVFDLPVVGEYYFGAIMKNPTINNLGEVLLIRLVAAFLSANTTALICLYLSNKIKKILLSSVIFIVVSFIFGIFPEIFGIRILSVISPLALCQIDDCYEFGMWIGGCYVSLYLITLMLYVIAMGILFIRIKKMK